jgi:uncharacterized protein YgiM (DUF1202 family)
VSAQVYELRIRPPGRNLLILRAGELVRSLQSSRAVRAIAIAIACLVAISGDASAGPRRKKAPAAAHHKPVTKTAESPRKATRPPRKRAEPPRKQADPPAPAPAPAPAPPPPPVTAARDVRKTLDKVIVRKRPGERQAAIATLPAGTEVHIEGEEGRWLRVRAGRVSGYLARTTVSDPAVPPAPDAPPGGGTAGSISDASGPGGPGEPGPRTRTWGGARRPDPTEAPVTELFVEVIAEAAELRAEARPDAERVGQVPRGARLAVLEVDEAAGWVRARDGAGRAGWIARAVVGNSTAAAAAAPGAAPDPAEPRAVRAAAALDPRATRRLALRADAGIGYRTFAMDFRSNGGGGLANYLVDSGAGAADLDVELALRPSPRWRVAVDGRLQLSRLGPGLDYPGPSAPPGKIAFSTFGADAGVRAGRRLGPAFEVWLRAGGHYDAFVATDVENAGRLPRERLLGATAGARVDVAPPESRITASLWADALVVGSRRQTPGLEDGTDSSVRAAWAGATLRFRIGAHVSILGAYDFGRVSTRWSGMSVRQPGATGARRNDGSQLVQIGLGAEL